LERVTGIPGNDKNAASDNDTEKLCQGVGKKKIVLTAEIQPDNDQPPQSNREPHTKIV